MSASVHAGAAPVGRLAELPPLERQLIRWLRLWGEGPAGRAAAIDELADRHGRAATERVATRFGELLLVTARHARRPLHGHAPGCPCVGGDECVLARLVALAAEGAREEAILMAALIVRADLALPLATLAEEVGLGLLRAGRPRRLQ
jgi:hypothetical protein